MALTAEEQALLNSLQEKAVQPEAPSKYQTLEDVVRYLVQTSDKFTANPDERTEILDFLDSLKAPADSNESN